MKLGGIIRIVDLHADFIGRSIREELEAALLVHFIDGVEIEIVRKWILGEILAAVIQFKHHFGVAAVTRQGEAEFVIEDRRCQINGSRSQSQTQSHRSSVRQILAFHRECARQSITKLRRETSAGEKCPFQQKRAERPEKSAHGRFIFVGMIDHRAIQQHHGFRDISAADE